MRAIAQTISYEVVFSLIILTLIIFSGCYDFFNLRFYCLSFALLPTILLMWLICILRELNRTPYDFAEGERELVSGFNVEYSRFSFALIFMAEYGFILLMGYITTLLFFQTSNNLLP
jgi:NADH-ubiquinone oxidoreductase chain 1